MSELRTDEGRTEVHLWIEFLMKIVAAHLLLMTTLLGQPVPTTQPIGDTLYFRTMESGGTVVLIQQRNNPAFLSTRDQWYTAVWYDTFIWRPGYNWAPFYGWEARHLTEDGRWIVLFKHGQLPKTVAILKTLENYRNVVWWRADFDHDNDIDQEDFATIQLQLGRVGPLSGDLNSDGIVDQIDVDLWWRLKLEWTK